MKINFLSIIASLIFLLGFQKENYLSLTNGQLINANYFVSLKGKVKSVSKKKIEFEAKCIFDGKKYFGYDKPRYLDIDDYGGLQIKLGNDEYKFVNSSKASYNITQNDKKFIIRSATFLKIKSNEPTTFQAYLYKICTNNESQNVIIIYGVKNIKPVKK